MESETVEVMDLYLAAYYLVQGCAIEEVRNIPAGKNAACSLLIRGNRERMREATEAFFASSAEVNLLDFRHAYNRVNTAIHQAKRNAGGRV
ncbi:hypothetical protein MASR2M78_22450 [Treponema sp.]